LVDASSWLRQGSNQTLTELTGSQATSISTQDTKLAELGTKITRLEASLAELRQQVCDKSKPPVDCTGSGYAHTSLCAHATRTASGPTPPFAKPTLCCAGELDERFSGVARYGDGRAQPRAV
jgi:hypothetical protein